MFHEIKELYLILFMWSQNLITPISLWVCFEEEYPSIAYSLACFRTHDSIALASPVVRITDMCHHAQP